jgi:hypothetical protein
VLNAALRRSWSLVKEAGVDQVMLSYRKTEQSTDRIARTTRNVGICRTFLRSVPIANTTRKCILTERRLKYRPRIDRTVVWLFADLSPS